MAWFRRKGYTIGFDWRDVWQEEHTRAFTVAKAMKADILTDIRQAMDKALAEGQTIAQFRKDLEPILRAKGWWGKQALRDPKTGEIREVQLGSPRRLKIIFDTNLRTAYAAGRWERIERNKETRPFLRYVGILDNRIRPRHRQWHGTILPIDDPWWDVHYPPNGWRCRCTVQQLSQRDLDRRDERPHKTAPPGRMRTWKNDRTGKTYRIPYGIDPGFAYNVGKAGSRIGTLPTPPTPAPGTIPVLDEGVAMAKFVADKKGGSARGGVYKGEDGITRMIKFYDDPGQSYSEAVANGIYRALELEAPRSSLVRMKNGKLAHAAEIITHQGELGLKIGKNQANKVLDGFAADVLLANWDAVGLGGDNLVKLKGGKLARIDQGGALLFRAQGGRKHREQLAWAEEWSVFANRGQNLGYGTIFKRAGLETADAPHKQMREQIRKIADLRSRTNDFAALVPAVGGVPAPDRDAILAMLRARADHLQKVIEPRLRKRPALLARAKKLRMTMGTIGYDDLVAAVRRTSGAGDAIRRGVTDGELAAIHAYTRDSNPAGWTYRAINRAGPQFLRAILSALRGGRAAKGERQRLKVLTDLLDAGLAKLPDYAGTVRRGTTLISKLPRRIAPGKIWWDDGYTSTSVGSGFGGKHRFEISLRSGKIIQGLSAFGHEGEVLIPRGTKFRVASVTKSGAVTEIRLEELE